MGTDFSTIQIKNHRGLNQEQFKEEICKYMKTRGFIPTTEEEAREAYTLAFSKKSDWVALDYYEEEFELGLLEEVAKGIAKAMKTYCMSISVWDSDMLELSLYGRTEKQKDKIVAGDLLWEELPNDPLIHKANRRLWEPLLSENHTWEELVEIVEGNEGAAEDILEEIAPMFGMDEKKSNPMMRSENSDILLLYFKKASEKKSISLAGAFKKIYGEVLEPLGFQKIKGRHPYFVRLIGNEIIHVITYVNRPSVTSIPNGKEFDIYCGVATVYRQRITLDESPKSNSNWLSSNAELYARLKTVDFDRDFWESIFSFTYVADNEESILCEMKRSLEISKQVMLPLVEEAKTLIACMDYFSDVHPSMLSCYAIEEDFRNDIPSLYCNEGLLRIKVDTNDYNKFVDRYMKSAWQEIKYDYKMGKCTKGKCEERFNQLDKVRLREIVCREEITKDKELYSKTLKELERRKQANIETLRSYGLDI